MGIPLGGGEPVRRAPSDINVLIGVDKPLGLSSHDAVARVRRQLGVRRVGHAGTLDPLATGVMVVGVGQAARLLGMLALDRKRYVARIRWGAETATDDAEGEPVRTAPVPAAARDAAAARELLAGFVGPQEQVPPAYSAISVGGERSYRRARAGETVELAARPIEVHAAELLALEEGPGEPVWTVAFDVSKGTYIRALARDIGRAAGGAAHLDGLVRTAAGCVGLSDCLALDAVAPDSARERALDPVRALGLPALELAPSALEDVRCGRPVRGADVAPRGGAADGAAPVAEGGTVALVRGGSLCALAVAEGGRYHMKDVFPQPIEGVA